MTLRCKGFNGRPGDYLLLETPVFKTAYGKRVFEYNASRLWNALPVTVRGEEDIGKFKTQIKTILFDGCEELRQKAYRYKR